MENIERRATQSTYGAPANTVPRKQLSTIHVPTIENDFDWAIHVHLSMNIFPTDQKRIPSNPLKLYDRPLSNKILRAKTLDTSDFRHENGINWDLDETMQTIFRNVQGNLFLSLYIQNKFRIHNNPPMGPTYIKTTQPRDLKKKFVIKQPNHGI